MIQSESESAVGLVVGISIIVVLSLLQVCNVRHDRRLRRLYAEADIRMMGGPLMVFCWTRYSVATNGPRSRQ